MKIVVWNECYLSGGADWSLIDLISAWPDPTDSLLIFVNRSHEGLDLIREKTKGRAEVRVFVSPLEVVNRFTTTLSPRPIRIFAWGWALASGALRYAFAVPLRGADALLMNNGGFPGGASNYIIALVASILRVPKRIMIVRNYPLPEYAHTKLSAIIRSICKVAVHRIVAVSESLKSALNTEGGIPENLLTRIYNGVNLSNKTPETGCQLLPGSKGIDGTVGIIGTLEERKGHALLFLAWAHVLQQLPEAKLWIVGSSKSGDKAKLVSLAEELGISKSLVWVELVRNVESIYTSLDLVVMPSIFFESFGRVVIESMAFGVPVVASRVGGIPELIDNGQDGYLFDTAQPDTLHKLIVQLLLDANLRREVAQRGLLKYHSSFTDSLMAKNYHALLASTQTLKQKRTKIH